MTINIRELKLSHLSPEQFIAMAEDLGRKRAATNDKHVNDGFDPEDYFDHSGIAIHNPWMSCCSRFEVDPYTTYGRAFIEWLFRPFFIDRPENILRRISEDIRGQGS